MSISIDGKLVSQTIREDIKKETAELKDIYAKVPKLAVILVGNNPASQTYVASKGKAAIECGFEYEDFILDENTSEAELLALVERLNKDNSVNGILVQLPLPKHLNEELIINTIDPKKDVDGFSPFNTGLLAIGEDCLKPCTPAGIIELLRFYNIQTSGKKVCVLGRSNIVGKPIALMLMQKDYDATVTVCNSKTPNLSDETMRADIIIAAIGKSEFLTADMVKEGSVVIDVGINRIKDETKKKGYRIVGDCDFSSLKDKCSYITPVPGGVGPMTITMLMKNTLKAFKSQWGIK